MAGFIEDFFWLETSQCFSRFVPENVIPVLAQDGTAISDLVQQPVEIPLFQLVQSSRISFSLIRIFLLIALYSTQLILLIYTS
jgi:hypothetical protein